VLIISDGKAGHLNQSIAFAKLKKLDYDIITIKNHLKPLSYILDFFHIYLNLFSLHVKDKFYKAVISTGSSTYYANKYLARKLKIKSIAIMLPKNFRYKNFDYILAQSHDNPPLKQNIITLPLGLSTSEPKGYIKKQSSLALGIIIGGNNSVFKMNKNVIKQTLDEIFEKYPNHLKYITTSRRTPKEIDELLKNYKFDYEIIYSQEPNINPIPDFLQACNELFITIDSTSMLSEARANSDANIHIIELTSTKQDTKFHKFANEINNIKERFNYTPYLDKVIL
jgi:mitochondrial fission protein ELM1